MHPKINKISLFFGLSLFFICTLLIAAPMFVSTNIGRKATLYLINKTYSGKIQAEKLSLSWFGKQEIRGLQWAHQKEGAFFRCEEITTSVPLWKLFCNHNLGQLKIISPHLELDAAFSPKLPLAVSKKSHALHCSFIPKFTIQKPYYGTLSIDKGTLLVFSKNKLLASFQKVSSQIHLPEEKFPIQLALIGQTEQEGEIGKFDIKAEISSFALDQPNLEVQAKLVHFPIFGLDELLSIFDPTLKGSLVEGIGPSFDLDLEAKFQPQTQELYLLAQSPLIHAQIEAESVDGRLTLKNPASINFSLPPSLFQKMGGFSLKNVPEVAIAVEKLSLPSGLNFKNIGFQADVKISSIELYANEDYPNEPIHIDGASFSCSSNGFEKELKLVANSSLKMGNLNSQILMKAELQDPFLKTIKGNCKLQIQEFPLKIAELILNEKLTPYLGNWFEGLCTLNIGPDSSLLTFKAATPLLKISEVQVALNDHISLLHPILADYHSSPRLSPIQLSIDQCVFPRSEWQKLQFNCHFQIPAIHRWMVDQLQGEITVNTLDNINMQLSGQEFKMKCLLALGSDLCLKEPLSLDYVLTPNKFQSLFPKEAKTPLLLAPASFHFSIEPFSASLEGDLLKNCKTKIAASIDALSFQYEQQIHTFKNLQFQCALDGPNKTLEGHFKTGGEQLELNVVARSLDRKLDFSKSHLNFTLKADQFPLSILDGLLDKSHPLTTLFGPSLTLLAEGEASPQEQIFSISAKGKQFNIETCLLIKDHLLEIKKPLHLDWLLNEKGYALLDRWTTGQKESPFELQKPAHFHLDADQLSYAIKDKNLFIEANLSTDHCNFTEKNSSRLVSLEHFKVAVNRKNQNSPLQIDLRASMNKQGKILFKGELTDLFTGKIVGQIEKLPTALLDLCARPFKRIDFPFSTFFGETLNAQISTDLKNFSGPIFLSIHSPNVRTSLTGKFENRCLSLKEPLHAQMLMTHKISSLFLKEVNPLSMTSVESIHPVTLQIDHVGFLLPFSSDWSKLKVPHAHIELGEIFCKNEGNIQLALALLKQNQEPMPDLKLWFTPIDLHIEHQICSLERTEILINNSLEICTFGEINLGKEDVNMTLGLTSQCLHKAFGIENLPPDYVLHIPLKGALDNVKLDAKKATAKITTLLLWQKSGLKNGEIGGGAGALIGELIGKLTTLPDRECQSPPAKVPYPWDKNKGAKVKQSKTKKKSKIKKDEKPLKALLKILT